MKKTCAASHRERSRLITERTAHVNRIKGLLFAQGIRGINAEPAIMLNLDPAVDSVA